MYVTVARLPHKYIPHQCRKCIDALAEPTVILQSALTFWIAESHPRSDLSGQPAHRIFLYDSFLLLVVPGPCYDTCDGAGNFMTALSSEVFAALSIGWSFLLSVIQRYVICNQSFGIPGWPRPIEKSKTVLF
jgi:hypothetical protein